MGEKVENQNTQLILSKRRVVSERAYRVCAHVQQKGSRPSWSLIEPFRSAYPPFHVRPIDVPSPTVAISQ